VESSAQKSVRQIKPAHWINVAARAVNFGIVWRERAKQVVKARRQIAQTGAQIQNVRGGENRNATRLEDAIDLANNLAIVFEVLDCFDAGHQREAIVAVRKHLPV